MTGGRRSFLTTALDAKLMRHYLGFPSPAHEPERISRGYSYILGSRPTIQLLPGQFIALQASLDRFFMRAGSPTARRLTE
jgi:hypothetical protein